MTATDAFFNWFFTGLNGLGGWFLFFLIALGSVIWLLYDSSKRRLPAIGWRLAAILTAALLLPTILFRFSSVDTQASLNQFVEAIFYLGLLGGIIPLVVAIGYFVTYRGMVGCPDGHVYEKELGQCPHPSHKPPVQVIQTPQPVPVRQPEPASPPASPPPPPKPKAQAWLVAGDGHSYQLNLELTTVGRSSANDIQITNDATVSREHAKIVEQNGHFRLFDLGSTSGTRINSRAVRQAVLLEPDDVIDLGDNTRLQFVTSRR